MDGRVHEDQTRVAILQALDGSDSSVGGAVVDDPEHAARVIIRWPRHYLLHEAIKGSDPILGLATPKNSGVMYVQCSHIGPGTATEIFVFDAHGGAPPGNPRGGPSPPRREAGLLVRVNG